MEICESCIYLRKSMPPYITSAKTYQQLTGMLCNVACHHDHVSDYRAQPPASDFMFCLGSLPADAFLSDHSQDVIGQDCQFQYQFVGLKFAGWQPLHIMNSMQYLVAARKREFGILRAMGITDAGFKRMLAKEGLCYGIYSGVTVLVIYFVVQKILYYFMIHVYLYLHPKAFVSGAALGGILLLNVGICVGVTLLSGRAVLREGIVEEIRE